MERDIWGHSVHLSDAADSRRNSTKVLLTAVGMKSGRWDLLLLFLPLPPCLGQGEEVSCLHDLVRVRFNPLCLSFRSCILI